MQKVKKNISLDSDVVEHIENNIHLKCFSDWVSEKYREEFMSIHSLVKKLEQKSKEYESLQKEIQRLRGEDSGSSLLTPQQEKWIECEGIRRVQRGTFEGVFKAFQYETGANVNRRQFRILLGQYQEVNAK